MEMEMELEMEMEMDRVPPGPEIPAPALLGGKRHPRKGSVPYQEQIKRLGRGTGAASLLIHQETLVPSPDLAQELFKGSWKPQGFDRCFQH